MLEVFFAYSQADFALRSDFTRADYGKLRAAVEALQAILEKENLDLIPPDWKASILQASRKRPLPNFLAREVTWASTLDYLCNCFQPAKSCNPNFLAREVTWASTLDYLCNCFQPAKSRVAGFSRLKTVADVV